MANEYRTMQQLTVELSTLVYRILIRWLFVVFRAQAQPYSTICLSVIQVVPLHSSLTRISSVFYPFHTQMRTNVNHECSKLNST